MNAKSSTAPAVLRLIGCALVLMATVFCADAQPGKLFRIEWHDEATGKNLTDRADFPIDYAIQGVASCKGTSLFNVPQSIDVKSWDQVVVKLKASLDFSIALNARCTFPPGDPKDPAPVYFYYDNTFVGANNGGATKCDPVYHAGQSGPGEVPITNGVTCPITGMDVGYLEGKWYARMHAFALIKVKDHFLAMTDAFAYYELPPQPAVKVDLVDPDCHSSADFVCNGYYPVVVDDAALSEATAVRKGAVSDGHARLIVRAALAAAKAPAGSIATFSLKKNGAPAGRQWGQLTTLDWTHVGDSVTAPFADLSTDGQTRFAYVSYYAPDVHPDPRKGADGWIAADVDVEVTTNARPDELARETIVIVPPPVVLVHGVWSDRRAWEGLEKYLVAAGIPVCADCRPDYGQAEPAGAFDPRSKESSHVLGTVVQAIQAGVRDARRRGYAAKAVDGVGHSMGGIVLRARESCLWDFCRPFTNDLHRIITVGSPHRGTPLVDWLLRHKCDEFSLLARVQTAKTIEQELARQGRPLGPAIYGFQTASIALSHIGTESLVHTRGHSIVGIAPDVSGTEHFLNKIPEFTGNKNPQGSALTIDEILGGAGTHDTIVGRASQEGGNSGVTSFAGLVHGDVSTHGADTGETESELEVWPRIVELLLSTTDAPFGQFGVYDGTSEGQPVIADTPCGSSRTTSAEVKALASTTMTPAPGTIVKGGDSVVLSFTVAGGTPVSGVLFSAGNTNAIVDGTGPSFTDTWVVPRGRAGRIDLLARTFGTGENYAAESYVTVEPSSEPLSIRLMPSELVLRGAGQGTTLLVLGRLADGSEIDLTSLSTVTVPANGAARVPKQGVIEAVRDGTVTATATYKSLHATAEVSVDVGGKRRAARH